MEETIAALGKSLGQFCNHLQSSVDALHQSLDRRPIPLDFVDLSFLKFPRFDDSISLKRLGISDVALATLALEANGKTLEPNPRSRQRRKNQEVKMHDLEGPYQPATVNLGASEVEGPKSVVKASKDEYESLPSYMKGLASWEDLLIAIEKINSYLIKKENCSENKSFFQDEISSLALGPKARSYLLLLTHMKHLVVETVDGLISYRIL